MHPMIAVVEAVRPFQVSLTVYRPGRALRRRVNGSLRGLSLLTVRGTSHSGEPQSWAALTWAGVKPAPTVAVNTLGLGRLNCLIVNGNSHEGGRGAGVPFPVAWTAVAAAVAEAVLPTSVAAVGMELPHAVVRA